MQKNFQNKINLRNDRMIQDIPVLLDNRIDIGPGGGGKQTENDQSKTAVDFIIPFFSYLCLHHCRTL